jgi:hypothetical protein
MRVFLAFSLVVVTTLVASAGCGDDPRYRREPIAIAALEYAEPVWAPANESLLVRARVGWDDCVLEESSIDVQGDTLVVSGVAKCIIRDHVNKVTTPPAAPNPQSFQVPLPALTPGSYVLCAGSLCDTLTVTPATVPTQETRVAATGLLEADSCTVLNVDWFPLRWEIATSNPFTVTRDVLFYGTFAGEATCDTVRATSRVRARRIE